MRVKHQLVCGKPLLHKDIAGLPRKQDWYFRGAVRILSYLANNTRPELSMAVHPVRKISCIFDIYMLKPKVHCKVFKDNCSAITITEASKFTPRTRHIVSKYHHFRQYVKDKIIKIFPISSKEQTVDVFTKPLDDVAFFYLRKKLNGW